MLGQRIKCTEHYHNSEGLIGVMVLSNVGRNDATEAFWESDLLQ